MKAKEVALENHISTFNETEEKRLTRRSFTLGAIAAAVSGREVGAQATPIIDKDNDNSTIDDSLESTDLGDVAMNAPSSPAEGVSADYYRQIVVEEKSYEKLSELLRIMAAEVERPEQYPSVIAHRIREYLKFGRTDEEISPFSPPVGSEPGVVITNNRMYLAETTNNYDVPAYTAMLDPNEVMHDGADVEEEAIRSKDNFRNFVRLSYPIREHAINSYNATGGVGEDIAVNVLGYRLTEGTNNDGSYGVTMEMQITNDTGGNTLGDIFSATGVIHVDVYPYANEQGLVHSVISSQPEFQSLWQELSKING